MRDRLGRAHDFAFVQDGSLIGGQTRRMDTTHEQFINDSARRPRGHLAEEGYGGPAGAPLRALHQRTGFEQSTVQTDQGVQLALARKGQP
jgi:hypothetical protein